MGIQPEAKFKARVMMDLGKIPDLYVLKTQERARKGVPDLLICWQGHFIAIELKVDGAKPTLLQQITLDKIVKSGGIAFYSTPSTWPGQYETLKSMLRG